MLGPCLWNTFFADVSALARSTGGKEAMFADDLNVFQKFDRLVPLPTVTSTFENCRARVHSWGRANRIIFDPGKEHLVVMHPSLGHGSAFKLHGCAMDTDLCMHSAVEQLMSKIRPKITAILRTRAYYKVPNLIGQFKTHIWGLIEAHNGGYFHAAAALLDKIEHAQNRFLRELEISPEQAFLDLNFVPPRIRRNIAILGLIRKRVIGECHPSFQRLLPWYAERFSESRAMPCHTKQLYGRNVEISHQRSLYDRWIFAMVDIYDNLSQCILDSPTVSSFQTCLNNIIKSRCESGDVTWIYSFSRRHDSIMIRMRSRQNRIFCGNTTVTQCSVAKRKSWTIHLDHILRALSSPEDNVFSRKSSIVWT